jgi:uncharacterized membrane protein
VSIVPLLLIMLPWTVWASMVEGTGQSRAEPRPYWKTPEVYKNIVDQRSLAVSAKIDKVGKDDESKERLKVVAAGHVAVPLSYAWQKVLQFERLPKVSSHFNKAEYTAANKQLYVVVAAMGYTAHLVLQLKFIEAPNHASTESGDERPDWKEIQWETIGGAFQGMTGTIRLEDYEHRRTEMSLVTTHETKKLPLPSAFKAFMIEVVSQRVAGVMREYIEQSYKEDQRKQDSQKLDQLQKAQSNKENKE